jgi:hypothetical protein
VRLCHHAVCPSWKQLTSYHEVWYECHATVGHPSLVLSKDTIGGRMYGIWNSCWGNLFLECKMRNMAAMRSFYLAQGSTSITSVPLELGLRSAVQWWITGICTWVRCCL